MYRRRKHNSCLNCEAQLDKVYNYCPLCGQENTDNDVSVRTLIGDVFNNYLSYDSRFAKSIKPFLFKPGYLTNEFMAGRRVTYVHPVRLYLVLSLLYFFAVSLSGIDGSSSTPVVQETDSVENVAKDDSLTVANPLKESDSGKVITFNDSGIDQDFWIITDENWEIFQELKDNREITDQQLLDSLNTQEMNFWEVLLAKQMIRVGRSDQQSIMGYIEKNLPLMMFFLLPVFALILKILYYRQKGRYIRDLIFAIHLHCFAYFIFGMPMIIYKLILPFGWLEFVLTLIGFVWITYYQYKSMRVVYKQKWFKTSVKMVLLGFTYSVAMLVAFLIELTISLLSY